MKILRFVLLLTGLALVIWGVSDYFSEVPETVAQGLPKLLLGAMGFLAALLSKSRR
ncbi:MAG: hypothetical protein K0U54_08080 [Bacteroidetes bacterium]|nr:hypothetical protein [Bacteroidota bacterium]